jgi:arginine decarboxylase
MKNKYEDLIEQTFDFPTDAFTVKNNVLHWYDVNIEEIAKKYGTPLKLTNLPKISMQIQKAKRLFKNGMKKINYKGNYNYCYCTKSSHFSFILNEVLNNDVHLETSSGFDIDIVRQLFEKGKISKKQFIVCNGYKKIDYIEKSAALINEGFENLIPVIDNKKELTVYQNLVKEKLKFGIRIASEEDPKFEFYTSRLGIGYKDIVPFYIDQIQDKEWLELKMLHFFINTGIQDTAYYWNELAKCVSVYCNLKEVCPHLDSLNIGGGFPIQQSLSFNYDYQYMIEEIVSQIKIMCNDRGVEEPNIFTEFGSYTVGEAGAVVYSIIGQKQQNDKEKWNMIDSSFMTTLPDTWAINKRFILFAINNWDKPYERVFLGGLTCDSDDYYNSEQHSNAIYLPEYNEKANQLIGFFHTGAYQETVGGYGGIQHCLTPAPKHIILNKNEKGEVETKLFAEEQKVEKMLSILGY